MGKFIGIILALVQVFVLFAIIPVNVSAQPLSYSVGEDNSLLIPQYSNAQTDSFTDSPDWLSSAIINEIRLETATSEGTLTAAIEVLDYYEQMGINCLWVTPVNETTVGNGYTNNGLHTVNLELTEASTYEVGWKNFANFVEAAHSRNIRILLDVIIWGVHYDAPMKNDPKYNGVVSDVENKWGGWSYNYNSTEYINYYTNTMLDIIDTTNIDGIRVDLAPAISGCSSLLGGIRKKAHEKGHSIVIMSEENSNDRTGGTGSRVYDLEQVGVLDYVNKDYWSKEFMDQYGYNENSNNWELNVYSPPDWWLTTAEGRDIVSTTKSGSIYAGTKKEQTAVTGTFLGWNDREIQTGKNQYYTYNVSFHDMATGKGDNLLAYGYSAIFAPVIPTWMSGDELSNQNGAGIVNNLYFNSYINTDLAALSSKSDFYETIKKYIKIRRTYSDIFEYFPENHRNSNICAVNVSGISTYQAYARYRNGKAVLVIPNGTENSTSINVTVPVAEAGIKSGYKVYDLMSDKKLNVSESNVFTVSVEPGEMAIVLVDDGTIPYTGSEGTIEANVNSKLEFAKTDAGITEKLIKNIGTVTVNSQEAIINARNAYNKLTKTEKFKVEGYSDLVKAEKQYNAIISNGGDNNYAGIITEENLYPNNVTYQKWGWSSVVENMGETADGGYNINYNYRTDGSGSKKGWSADYRFEIAKPISLDGASAQFTIDTSDDYYSKIFFLKISSKHMDLTENGNLGIKFDVGGGQIFFRTNGTACDHSNMPGYIPSIATDRIFTSLGGKIKFDFSFEEDGSLIINVNNVNYKISAEDMNKAYGINAEDSVLFYLSAYDSSYPDITIDYINDGKKEKNNSCEDYVVKSADMLPEFSGNFAGWANYIKRSDTAEGLRVEYLSSLPADYRLWTKSTYNMDGLHMKLTYNGTSYYERMWYLSFTNSSGNINSGLHLKIDSNGSQVYVGRQGYGWIDTTGMKTSNPAYRDRVFDSAFNKDTIEILITKQLDGGFILDINGYEFPVSAEQISNITSLSDTECVYVGISSIGSTPDYTLNYLHSSDEVCYSCEKGDINCDHQINIIDLIKLKNLMGDYLNEHIYTSDINDDGFVNGLDLTKLRKILIKLL